MVEIKVSTPTKIQVSGFEDNKVGTFQSVLAGIGAGLIDIPRGAFSLGASLLDLGLGTNKAAQVESFFDNLTTFDEQAEATTAGEIARIIANLGVPGTVAFKAGSRLTKQALAAKKNNTYFQINEKTGKLLEDTLTAKGKALTTLGGVGGIAAADAIFVGDPEKVGTLGDAFGIGPTQLTENDENLASREIMNRIKFGLDSAMLGGLLAGTGGAIKAAAKRSGQLRKNNDALDKVLEYVTPQGAKTREFFDVERLITGERSVDANKAQVLHRQLDKNIDALFPIINRIGSASVQKQREGVVKIVNDALTSTTGKGPRFIEETGRFTLGEMSPEALEKVRKIKGLNVKEVEEILNESRNIIDNMYTEIGNNILEAGKRGKVAQADIDASFKKFKDAFETKAIDYINGTYQIFRNNSVDALKSYKPTQEALDDGIALFKSIARKRGDTGFTDESAKNYINLLLGAAKGNRGFITQTDAVPLIPTLPKGFLKEIAIGDWDKGLLPINRILDTPTKEIPGVRGLAPREVIENLLGKVRDPSATILASVNNLSFVKTKHKFFGDLFDQLYQKPVLDDLGKPLLDANDNPVLQGQFFDNFDDAVQVFGPKNVDQKPLNMLAETMDPGRATYTEAVNPLHGLYTSKGNKAALEGTNRNLFSFVEDGGALASFYNNFILYPKATSQLAKTVLAPVTHVRNFISAGAFAAANGIVPLIDQKALDEAYGAFKQIGRRDDKVANARYEKLLSLGVVNKSVPYGDLQNILNDVDFGSAISQRRAFRGISKKLSKIKEKFADAYVAEDDYWKMYTFAAERSRIDKALKSAQIDGTLYAKNSRNDLGRAFASYDDYLDEAAASIVRNNVPNYDYVSKFIKELRRAPFGNFVSFPAEIIRTSINIMRKGFDEFNFVDPITGAKPFKGIGMQRLAGFGLTTLAIPYGTMEAFKAAYNVTGAEMDALRRFVPEWSKNSVLIPIRDDDGNLKYIDFSHANAYDTVARPLKTVFNAIADGRTDTDTVMEDVIQGMVEATSELGQPFISESIWTEAVLDIYRGGRTAEGRRLYTDQTPTGDKVRAAIEHLFQAQLPFSAAQFQRLGNAVVQNPDDYGRTYELKDELMGFAGLRAIDVDPVRSMKFKIADFSKGRSNARREFTAPLLRGGPVTPEEIVEKYQVANNALYKVNKKLADDYYAARTLGVEANALDAEFEDRVSRIAFENIKAGRFKPFVPSENIINAFEENARAIGQPNPYLVAQPVIDNIRRSYEGMSLYLDEFPIAPNPFSPAAIGLPTAGIQDNVASLPNLGIAGVPVNVGGAPQNTIAKGQNVFGVLDPVFGGS